MSGKIDPISIREALKQVHEFMLEDHKSGDSALWTVAYSELFDVVDAALAQAQEPGEDDSQLPTADDVKGILGPPPQVDSGREEIARIAKEFVDSALRWYPVFDDGRGGNDLTAEQTSDLICGRLALALRPESGGRG